MLNGSLQYAERENCFLFLSKYMYEYTGYRLKCRDTSGWCNQILRSCDGDEEAALWKFYEIYDEFIQIRMKSYWKAELSEDNIAWNNRMEHAYSLRSRTNRDSSFVLDEHSIVKEPVYNDPLAVYVIELTIPVYILAVETVYDVQLNRRFFMSLEKVKGNHCISEGVEVYFGPVDDFPVPTLLFEASYSIISMEK